MPAKVTRVQLSRNAGGRALRWLQLSASRVLIRPRSSPGGTGGYFADTSAADENQALVSVVSQAQATGRYYDN